MKVANIHERKLPASPSTMAPRKESKIEFFMIRKGIYNAAGLAIKTILPVFNQPLHLEHPVGDREDF